MNHMDKVYFMRHGESEANAQAMCAGQSDSTLTNRGILQAHQAGVAFAKAGLRPDIIIASPLIRALHSAREFARVLDFPEDNIIVDPDITERYCGDYEGNPSPSWIDLTQADLEANRVESEASMTERANRFLETLKQYDGKLVLIASHDQFGRSLIAAANNRAKDNITDLPNARPFPLYTPAQA